jgi:DNA-binding response OmpR family regulator
MPTKILIVDDTPVVLDFLEFVFRQEGFEVVRAASGYQALDLASGSPPDVALVDVMMPGIDGLEVCRRMRTDPRTSRTPILLYSAIVGEEIEAQGRAAGADDFLGKTLHHVELVARVRDWLAAASRPGGIGPAPLVDLALDLVGLLQSELVWLLAARSGNFEHLALACERGEQEARRFLSVAGPGPFGAGVGTALGEGIRAGRPRLDWALTEVSRFPDGAALAEAAGRIGARSLTLAPLVPAVGPADLLLFTSPTTLSLDRRGASAVAVAIRHATMGLALWRAGGLSPAAYAAGAS